MVKPIFGIGKLGLRLAVAFLGVALASIIVLSYVTEISTGNDVKALAQRKEQGLSRSVAVAAGAMYDQRPVGWGHANLMPVLDLVSRGSAGAEVLDAQGKLVEATPGFASMRADDEFRTPIVAKTGLAGWVVVKFNDRGGLGAVVRQFEAERLRASLSAAAIVALMALAVSLLISRQITLPLERVLAAIRARGAGDRSVRISDVRGVGVVAELSVALNESTDAIDKRDRLQRNLVANIAHELRTPVAILQASHEAMLDGVTEPTTENLWSLRDEVLRLARMIEDLQRLAAAEAAALQLKLVPQDLSRIAADAAGSLSDSFGAAGVLLIRRLDAAWTLCDPDRMREVVVNLLTNALKFTPAGGSVVLETSRGERGRVTLRVVDTGVGIPPEELPRVTERFFRGQRSSGMATGSGIGLTIVAELVRAQHGHLRISSQLDQGTQALITMPAAKWPAEDTAADRGRVNASNTDIERKRARAGERRSALPEAPSGTSSGTASGEAAAVEVAGRDAEGRDAEGRDAEGRDAEGRDAEGREAQGREAAGPEAGDGAGGEASPCGRQPAGSAASAGQRWA
jgi:two-component system sensor histidine kinase BaeS